MENNNYKNTRNYIYKGTNKWRMIKHLGNFPKLLDGFRVLLFRYAWAIKSGFFSYTKKYNYWQATAVKKKKSSNQMKETFYNIQKTSTKLQDFFHVTSEKLMIFLTWCHVYLRYKLHFDRILFKLIFLMLIITTTCSTFMS